MNAIRAIHPYRREGLWVFDDEAVGLWQKPFVAGADGILVWLGGPAVSGLLSLNVAVDRKARQARKENPADLKGSGGMSPRVPAQFGSTARGRIPLSCPPLRSL